MVRDRDFAEQPPKNTAALLAGVTIEEIVIPVEWVIVSATIPAKLAAFLESKPSRGKHYCGEAVWNHYSTPIFSHLINVKKGLTVWITDIDLGAEVARWEDLRGHRSATFRFRMKARHWKDIQSFAKLSGRTESALIRAALWERYSGFL